MGLCLVFTMCWSRQYDFNLESQSHEEPARFKPMTFQSWGERAAIWATMTRSGIGFLDVSYILCRNGFPNTLVFLGWVLCNFFTWLVCVCVCVCERERERERGREVYEVKTSIKIWMDPSGQKLEYLWQESHYFWPQLSFLKQKCCYFSAKRQNTFGRKRGKLFIHWHVAHA